MHTPRAVLLQTLGHFVLGHAAPADFADFLRQRVEANYFAAAVLVPEQAAVAFLRAAKETRDLSVEDLRDVFSVSYEMAAHRFTNLATHHLGLPCHFVKNDAGGIIYKAYENDGVSSPPTPTGAIEGQRMCRYWSGRQVFSAADRFSPHYQYSDTPSGTYWCVASVDPGQRAGVRDHARRGVRRRALVPRPGDDQADEVRLPGPAMLPAAARQRWPPAGTGWPGRRRGRTRTSCSALPSGSFPGVDEADVYAFLDRHERD